MRPLIHLLAILPAIALTACGGGGGSIGGSLSGLAAAATIVLQNNGSDSLTLTSNGTFAFATDVVAGDDYNVTVLTQPAGQTCTVANASGTVGAFGGDVDDITVTCVTSLSVSGSVSGLVAGTSVTLSNAGVMLPVAVDGPFVFPGTLAAGTTYSVAVSVQPVGRTCTVANATGTIAAGVATNVLVSCA